MLTYSQMGLKNIAISERNYMTLKNLGKAGDSFNDVICKLIKEMHHEDQRLNESNQNCSLRRGLETTIQTEGSSVNSDT